MRLELTPQQVVANITGISLLAEMSHNPALVQHLSPSGRQLMVEYFDKPDCMVLADLSVLMKEIVRQSKECLKQAGL